MPWVPVNPPFPPDPWSAEAPGAPGWTPRPTPGVEYPFTLLFDGFATYNGLYLYDGVKHIWRT